MSESPYLRVAHEPALKLVRVTRTGLPIPSAADVTAMVGHARRLLAQVPRGERGVLLDLRQASLQDETNYADAMVELRREISQGFRKVAFLVQTEIGMLQVRRFVRAEKLDAQVFRDEASALKHLNG